MKHLLSVLVILCSFTTSIMSWSEDQPAKESTEKTDAEKPAEKAAPIYTAEYHICRNKKQVRTVHVEKDKDGLRCVTVYTRNGVDKEVARGLNHGSCVKVAGNIRVNLEKAGWACKEIANSSVTTSKEDATEIKN